jgi:hypothetical protein
VYVTNAVLDLADGERLLLGRSAEGWRLSAVGCKPRAKPAGVPDQCALEA